MTVVSSPRACSCSVHQMLCMMSSVAQVAALPVLVTSASTVTVLPRAVSVRLTVTPSPRLVNVTESPLLDDDTPASPIGNCRPCA